MENINTYIVPVVLIICLCVGYVMKHLIPSDRVNRYIPATVAVLGVVIASWNADFALSPSVISVGLVSGLASTGLHEAFRNFIDNNKKI